MLTKKIVSSSIAFALTASVALLAGCPTPSTTDPSASPSTSGSPNASPSASASASASTSASASVAPSSTASASVTPSGSATPSASQSATNTTTPSGQVGTTSDIKELATFNGKVYDQNAVPVDGATVTAKSLDTGVTWVGEAQVTVGGAYVFRNAPSGARILITATKDGWTTRNRSEVLKSNLQGNPGENVFHFGGTDAIYHIQDEPEVTMVKINGKVANAPGGGLNGDGTINGSIPLFDHSANLSGLDPNLEIEMEFSEPVKAADVRNYFRVVSQNFTNPNHASFSVDENFSGIEFTTTDDKTFSFKTKRNVLQTKDGNEARYKLQFIKPFKDKTDKEAISGKFIRFSTATKGDALTFSVKNDSQDPVLQTVQAVDGGANVDKIILTFSEPLEVINKSSYEAGLIDPANPNVTASQKIAQIVSDGANNSITLAGYNAGGATFTPSYAIAKLESPIANGNFLKNLGNTVTSVSLRGNQVTMEFPSTAFKRDDRVLVSVGRLIKGGYSDTINGININFGMGAAVIPNFAVIADPAGRSVSDGNSTTSGNVTINDSQRVSTAS